MNQKDILFWNPFVPVSFVARLIYAIISFNPILKSFDNIINRLNVPYKSACLGVRTQLWRQIEKQKIPLCLEINPSLYRLLPKQIQML